MSTLYRGAAGEFSSVPVPPEPYRNSISIFHAVSSSSSSYSVRQAKRNPLFLVAPNRIGINFVTPGTPLSPPPRPDPTLRSLILLSSRFFPQSSRVLEAERWFLRARRLAPDDSSVHHHYGTYNRKFSSIGIVNWITKRNEIFASPVVTFPWKTVSIRRGGEAC